MRGIVIVSRFLVPPMYEGITIFPFIFIRKKEFVTSEMVNHEQIHIAQQLELLVLPFYVLYVLMFLSNLFRFDPTPYHNIPFEKEAYANQDNLRYLQGRKFWAWIRHF